MNKIKTIALIAHDNKKQEIIEWAIKNKDIVETVRNNLINLGIESSKIIFNEPIRVY